MRVLPQEKRHSRKWNGTRNGLHHPSSMSSLAGDCGYTLLETVLSLIVLCAVVVPLLNVLYRGHVVADARRELTGIWLVEREATVVTTFPREALPVKRRHIENREWTIRTEVSETEPLQYRITAELRGKIEAEARFYGRAEDDRK